MLKRDKEEIIRIARAKLTERDNNKLLYDAKLWVHWKNSFCGHAHIITNQNRDAVTCPNCLKHIISIYDETNLI